MYATSQQFAGQRVSKGRIVIVRRIGVQVEPAIVYEVAEGDVFFARTTDGARCTCFPQGFEGTRTAADIEDMPAGAWTWPPRA
jgi:hypothetical protein